MSKRIAVVGAGSWGTALAQVLATAGSQVVMWARKPEVADGITNEHRNPRYLSDSVLLPSILVHHFHCRMRNWLRCRFGCYAV